jgi:hypothetical protein
VKEEIFGDPTNLFEKRINEIFAEKPETEFDSLLRLVTMLIAQNSPSDDMVALYHLVSLEDFVRIISLFDGRMVRFFSRKDIQETMVVALCFYYKEVVGLDWPAIREKLPFSVNATAYGTKIKRLSRAMRDQMSSFFTRGDVCVPQL